MKAAIYEKYGNPDVLEIVDIPKPNPKENEVLIKVHAASINNWDWDRLTGNPKVFRLMTGLFKPRIKILGCDITGVVESVGANIKDFKIGDEVFGDVSPGNWSGFAEYVCADEKYLAKKHPNLSFEEAAALPQNAVMALQGIRDYRNIKEGESVLINGAGGGFGLFAIQLAKHHGAEVTGVDKTEKFDFMKSLGVDHVIDYREEKFINNNVKYDFIIEVMARFNIKDYYNSLKEHGTYIVAGGGLRQLFQTFVFGSRLSKKSNRKLSILMHTPNRKDLEEINKLIDKNIITKIHYQSFPLSNIKEAFQLVGDGKSLGKVVIKIA